MPNILRLGAYTSSPRSIVIGYFNDDPILDIAVANFATHNVAVLLGFSNGTFASRKMYSTGYGSFPYSISIGDFNNDNRSDIVVANVGTHSIALILGFGNGTFADQISFSIGSSIPLSIADGDLNRDTFLDIVVACYGTNQIAVLLGYGNGSFQLPITYSTGYDSSPYFVIIADFNRDSWLDIAIAYAGIGSVGVFLGYHNGSLASAKTYSTGSTSVPYAIGIGDFNHDTNLDLAVANSDADEIVIVLGYGNGSFKSRVSVSLNSGSNPQSLVIGDFNNDNKSDIAIANKKKDSIGILLGHGNGDFAAQVEYYTGTTSQPISIVAGDFNHDNQLDIAFTSSGFNTVGILLALNTDFGGKRTTWIGNDSHPVSIADGDFNKDALLDIVVANYYTGTIDVLLGQGDAIFILFTTYSTGVGSNPQFIATGDFNHDGQLDIIVANHGTDNVGIVLGHGNGTFTELITYSTGHDSNPSSIAIGDFDNDSYADIAVANAGTNNVGVLLGYGNGTFSIQTIYSMDDSSQPRSIVVGDFNNDNRLDIAVHLATANSVNILLGYGNGSFQNIFSYPTEPSSLLMILALGDFNNDNNIDLAAVSTGTSNLYISLGYGNGTIEVPTKYSTGISSNPIAVQVVDLNDDGILDVVVANYGKNNVGVFFGYGNGAFANQRELLIGSAHPISIATGDFNQDGWVDIVVVNDFSNNIVVLLRNYYVNYQSITTYSTGFGSHPYNVVTGDFDKDSHLDMAIANSYGDNIGVLHGFGNGTFEAEVIYSTGAGSTPFVLAVADFNNDYQLDIACANIYGFSIGVLLGHGNGTFESITTYSTGYNVPPVSIAVDDFNNDNRSDIVVAQSIANNIGIFFGYNYTTFLNTQMYSTGYLSHPTAVVVGDFNKDNHLDIGVTNLDQSNIGILLGLGNGTFTNEMTYSTGSATFPTYLCLGDFNNDTQLDIAVVNQNPESIGIFIGYENGTFENIGILPTGKGSRPRYLTVSDLNNDGRMDIAITNTGSNNIGVFLGYGNGSFESQRIFSTGANAPPSGIATGDFNNDGFMDISVTILNNSNIGIFLGDANGTFREINNYSMGTGTTGLISIALGDINSDKQIDIVVADSEANQVGIFLGRGDGTFESVCTLSTGDDSFPSLVIVDDINNDKRQDICILNIRTQKVAIFYGHGNGNFITLTNYATGSDALAVHFVVGDLNHDNKLDIVLAISVGSSVGVLLASDSRPFSHSILLSTGSDSLPNSVAVGDFNNDNRKDIVVANPGMNNIGIFLGNGNGIFQNMMTYTTGDGSYPMSIAVRYLNHDYCLDIAVANQNQGTIGIFLGQCDGTFQKQVLYSTGDISIPISIALDDFNNDNVTDIAVANYGSNSAGVLLGYKNGTFSKQTLYTVGYGSHPVSVYISDFNEDGWMDIALSSHFDDSVTILLNLCEP
ncbi:unnamed protein product [Rotaria sp. Silwood1]|nr:unnamed protein product [Rotaria sp. Silwood1]